MKRTAEEAGGVAASTAMLPYGSLLEDAFGVDLSAVRVLLGVRGPLELLGVEAMSWGDTVAFSSAQPCLTQVAHEVAHVLQHRLAVAEGRRPAGVSRPGDEAEVEASIAALAVAAGLPATVALPATSALCCDWPGMSVEDQTFIEEKGSPPATAEAAVADFEWSIMLRKWAYANQDETAINVVTFVHEYVWTFGSGSSISLEAIAGQFCGVGASWPIEWPPDIQEQFTIGDDGAWTPATNDEDRVKATMFATAVAWIDQSWYPAFAADVAQIQAQAQPVAMGITRDQIDRDFVRNLSQMNLKAAQNVGDTLRFVQSGDLVFVGDGFPPSWEQLLTQEGGAVGWITIKSRGGTFSTGEIVVQGCAEQDAFKAAIAEFSKKKVSFEAAAADEEAPEEDAAGAPPADFLTCWADPVWKPRYVQWIEQQQQGENVHFLTFVEESYAPAPTMEWADYLAGEFIGEEARQQVNISGPNEAEIRTRLAGVHASGEGPPADLFDAAATEIRKTLMEDYPRFPQAMLAHH